MGGQEAEQQVAEARWKATNRQLCTHNSLSPRETGTLLNPYLAFDAKVNVIAIRLPGQISQNHADVTQGQAVRERREGETGSRVGKDYMY